MISRATALWAAGGGVALALAQDVVPGAALYHTWQYALAVAVVLTIAALAIVPAWRGRIGARGRWLAVALAAAAALDVAGLASGLLGPDTARIIGDPGTVTPIPALGAAAFFGAADADTIARGNAGVVLRRRGAAALRIAGAGHRLDGESILGLDARPAAFIDAWGARGEHLTITQPANASFLSPVLLFRQRQRIGEFDVPIDGFATPGRARVFRALYFSVHDLANFHRSVADLSHPALVLSVADDSGRPGGIVLLPSGQTVTIGGVRVRATIGSYPALSIASAPPVWALALGLPLFALGIAAGFMPSRRKAAVVQPAGV